jgi:predicted Fe-S protein YdhL (DUF1289 family)
MCERVHDVVICIHTNLVDQPPIRFCPMLSVTFCNGCGESAEAERHECRGKA